MYKSNRISSKFFCHPSLLKLLPFYGFFPSIVVKQVDNCTVTDSKGVCYCSLPISILYRYWNRKIKSKSKRAKQRPGRKNRQWTIECPRTKKRGRCQRLPICCSISKPIERCCFPADKNTIINPINQGETNNKNIVGLLENIEDKQCNNTAEVVSATGIVDKQYN